MDSASSDEDSASRSSADSDDGSASLEGDSLETTDESAGSQGDSTDSDDMSDSDEEEGDEEEEDIREMTRCLKSIAHLPQARPRVGELAIAFQNIEQQSKNKSEIVTWLLRARVSGAQVVVFTETNLRKARAGSKKLSHCEEKWFRHASRFGFGAIFSSPSVGADTSGIIILFRKECLSLQDATRDVTHIVTGRALSVVFYWHQQRQPVKVTALYLPAEGAPQFLELRQSITLRIPKPDRTRLEALVGDFNAVATAEMRTGNLNQRDKYHAKFLRGSDFEDVRRKQPGRYGVWPTAVWSFKQQRACSMIDTACVGQNLLKRSGVTTWDTRELYAVKHNWCTLTIQAGRPETAAIPARHRTPRAPQIANGRKEEREFQALLISQEIRDLRQRADLDQEHRTQTEGSREWNESCYEELRRIATNSAKRTIQQRRLGFDQAKKPTDPGSRGKRSQIGGRLKKLWALRQRLITDMNWRAFSGQNMLSGNLRRAMRRAGLDHLLDDGIAKNQKQFENKKTLWQRTIKEEIQKTARLAAEEQSSLLRKEPWILHGRQNSADKAATSVHAFKAEEDGDEECGIEAAELFADQFKAATEIHQLQQTDPDIHYATSDQLRRAPADVEKMMAPVTPAEFTGALRDSNKESSGGEDALTYALLDRIFLEAESNSPSAGRWARNLMQSVLWWVNRILQAVKDETKGTKMPLTEAFILRRCLVVPVFKSGDMALVGRYRPIGLLSVIRKLLTGILTKRFQVNFSGVREGVRSVGRNMAQSPWQGGFTPNIGRTELMAVVMAVVDSARLYGLEVGLSSQDIKGAFNALMPQALREQIVDWTGSEELADLALGLLRGVVHRVQLGQLASKEWTVNTAIQGDPFSTLTFLLVVDQLIRAAERDIDLRELLPAARDWRGGDSGTALSRFRKFQRGTSTEDLREAVAQVKQNAEEGAAAERWKQRIPALSKTLKQLGNRSLFSFVDIGDLNNDLAFVAVLFVDDNLRVTLNPRTELQLIHTDTDKVARKAGFRFSKDKNTFIAVDFSKSPQGKRIVLTVAGTPTMKRGDPLFSQLGYRFNSVLSLQPTREYLLVEFTEALGAVYWGSTPTYQHMIIRQKAIPVITATENAPWFTPATALTDIPAIMARKIRPAFRLLKYFAKELTMMKPERGGLGFPDVGMEVEYTFLRSRIKLLNCEHPLYKLALRAQLCREWDMSPRRRFIVPTSKHAMGSAEDKRQFTCPTEAMFYLFDKYGLTLLWNNTPMPMNSGLLAEFDHDGDFLQIRQQLLRRGVAALHQLSSITPDDDRSLDDRRLQEFRDHIKIQLQAHERTWEEAALNSSKWEGSQLPYIDQVGTFSLAGQADNYSRTTLSLSRKQRNSLWEFMRTESTEIYAEMIHCHSTALASTPTYSQWTTEATLGKSAKASTQRQTIQLRSQAMKLYEKSRNGTLSSHPGTSDDDRFLRGVECYMCHRKERLTLEHVLLRCRATKSRRLERRRALQNGPVWFTPVPDAELELGTWRSDDSLLMSLSGGIRPEAQAALEKEGSAEQLREATIEAAKEMVGHNMQMFYEWVEARYREDHEDNGTRDPCGRRATINNTDKLARESGQDRIGAGADEAEWHVEPRTRPYIRKT